MKKIIFIVLGSITFACGTVGLFLPGLPTTGFYILTAYLWLHSSETLHQKFVSSTLYQENIEKKLIKRQITIAGQIKLYVSMFVIFLIPALLLNTAMWWWLFMGLFLAHVLGLSLYFNFDKIKHVLRKEDIIND